MKTGNPETDAMPYCHVPVMLNEVVHYLNCEPGKIYVDCTLGGSGHSRAILEKIMPDGLLIGIDQDEAAINNAKKNLKLYEKISAFFIVILYIFLIFCQNWVFMRPTASSLISGFHFIRSVQAAGASAFKKMSRWICGWGQKQQPQRPKIWSTG